LVVHVFLMMDNQVMPCVIGFSANMQSSVWKH
jgi:hypothetical protein